MRASLDSLTQLSRYACVGIVTNGLMFLAYLWLSTFGIGAKTAMTLLYVPGVLLAFLGNRSFTFRYEGALPASLARFVATYALGYAFNFFSLLVFVDFFRFPADIIVLTLIVVTAVLLFLTQRWWVFATPDIRSEASEH